jgi:hypothetical protein
MPDMSGRDPLHQAELVMALENELGTDAVGDLTAEAAAMLQAIVCWPYELRWAAPEPESTWPATVRVIGEDGRRVLFLTGRSSRIGVGCRGVEGVISAVRVYPSLPRALFAFARHACPSPDGGT